MKLSGIDSILKIMDEIDRSKQPNKQITEVEYDSWRNGFVFDGLRNLRYGQSFCNHFDIHDNILFYSRTVTEAHDYIVKNYIR